MCLRKGVGGKGFGSVTSAMWRHYRKWRFRGCSLEVCLNEL